MKWVGRVGWSSKARLRVGGLPPAVFWGGKNDFVPYLSVNVRYLSVNVPYLSVICPLMLHLSVICPLMSLICPLMGVLGMTVCLRDLLCKLSEPKKTHESLVNKSVLLLGESYLISCM